MAVEDPYARLVTNSESKFSSFSLKLQNGATLTGIVYIPTATTPSPLLARPLLIGIHGATCCAHGWDVSPKYTASLYSDLANVPFVAFHRPNFLGSSGWIQRQVPNDNNNSAAASVFPPGPSRTFFQEEAHWYHEQIFPALWNTFGVPNNCTSLVTTSHSMSVPITIIAAGLYSSSASSSLPPSNPSPLNPPNPSPGDNKSYPWAGMILTGFGEERTQTLISAAEAFATNTYAPSEIPFGHDPGLHIGPFLPQDKISLMLGPEGCSDPSLRALCLRQTTPFFLAEVLDMTGHWVENKETYKAKVRIPVLHGLGGFDWIWKSDREHVEMFLRGFTGAPRVEGAVVEGAPHAIEWSKVSAGWWMRVMGWAMEVAGSREVGRMGLKGFD